MQNIFSIVYFRFICTLHVSGLDLHAFGVFLTALQWDTQIHMLTYGGLTTPTENVGSQLAILCTSRFRQQGHLQWTNMFHARSVYIQWFLFIILDFLNMGSLFSTIDYSHQWAYYGGIKSVFSCRSSCHITWFINETTGRPT
jgi:hypothetical protein